ncbi:MAG: hypothetical protein PHP82_03065, partial [Candidatus ainarchaeum sp.]|nr:hypothetical protein [Candidatus ainarchaeum sp.]
MPEEVVTNNDDEIQIVNKNSNKEYVVPPERESSNEIDKNIEFSSSNDSKGSSSSIDPSKRVHTGING